MFGFYYQCFLNNIISVSTNHCKVACWENVRTGAWWCLSSGCLAINSNRNQLCEAITLVTQFAEVLPFASAFKNTPFSTVPNSALSLVSPVFDYSYYHKLLLLALAAIMCPLCSACVHACVYPSLFLLGAVCLSPPDCNPVVVGSVFCNLSWGVWVCMCIW